MKRLRKALAKKAPDAAVGGAINLGFLGHWHGQHGVRAILDGESQGWAEMDRTLHYLALEVQLVKRTMRVSLVASALANALLFDEDAMAEALASLLLESRNNSRVFTMWEAAPWGIFMLKLWGLLHSEQIDVVRPNMPALGAYQRVLDAWHDERALPEAIAGACDYHLEQTLESGYGEFYFSPYRLFPADILVIGHIRRKLGLPMPEVFHPLLDTPLAKVPPAAERPRMGPDPLFEEVLARAKKDGLIP